MKFVRSLLKSITIGVVAAIASTDVIAQESESVLEEVIVTAQKREQDVQKLGMSVTVLTSDVIDRAAITDVSRLQFMTPGLTYGFIATDAKIAIRGANSNNTFRDNSSIAGVFIDGVYQPRAAQQRLGYFDVQRIEVLKGPQGTLYGRNTFAGAINVYTNRPSTDGTHAGIAVTAARFNTQRIEGFYNAPVSDHLAIRAAGVIESGDGWVKNYGSGRDSGIKDSSSLRLSALWNTTEDLEIVARYTHLRDAGTSLGIFAAEYLCNPKNELYDMFDPYGTGIDCSYPQRGDLGTDKSTVKTPWTINLNNDTERGITSDTFAMQIRWDMGVAILSSITSYTDFASLYSTIRQDGSNYWNEDANSFTQELVLTFSGNGVLQSTVGGYFSHDDVWNGSSTFDTGTTEPFTETRTDAVGNVIRIPTNTARIDLFGGGDFSDFNTFQRVEADVIGVFGQFEWSLTDSFRLIAGVRYNEEKKENTVVRGTSGLSAADAPFGWNPAFPPSQLSFSNPPLVQDTKTFHKVTWRAGLEWSPSQHSMVYVNTSTGYLSGGLNTNGSSFDQQDSQAYEVGFKSRMLSDRLQLNAALYRNEFTNLTTQKLIDLNADGIAETTITENGGEVKAQGFEVELSWLPTDAWFISMFAALLDNEYKAFGVSNPFQLNNGVRAADVNHGLIDLQGQTPPWSPEVTVGIGSSYRVNMGGMGWLTPYVQFYYSDGFNTDDVSNYSTQWQKAYTKTDFRLTWTLPNEHWDISMFVENIENEAVLARTNTAGGGVVQGSYDYPRNYGVKFNYQY